MCDYCVFLSQQQSWCNARWSIRVCLNLWEKQKITSADLIVVNQQIFDQATQNIFSQLYSSSKRPFFHYLIATHNLQFHLRKYIPIKYQKCISSFWLSSHQLAIETVRFYKYNIERHIRNCFLYIQILLKTNFISF